MHEKLERNKFVNKDDVPEDRWLMERDELWV